MLSKFFQWLPIFTVKAKFINTVTDDLASMNFSDPLFQCVPIHFYALGSQAFFVFIEYYMCSCQKTLRSITSLCVWCPPLALDFLPRWCLLIHCFFRQVSFGQLYEVAFHSLCDVIRVYFFSWPVSLSLYWLWQESLSPDLNVSSHWKTCAFPYCLLFSSCQNNHQALRKYCLHKSLALCIASKSFSVWWDGTVSTWYIAIFRSWRPSCIGSYL